MSAFGFYLWGAMWGAMIYWAYCIGKNKNRAGLGLLLGVVLGLVGVLLITLVPPKQPPISQGPWGSVNRNSSS
jgi:hypothetical protein